MYLEQAVQDVKKAKLAGIRYEREGHSRFRDCVTVMRNGRLLFERYSYGEAASLTFELWAKGAVADGVILWNYDAIDYSGKQEAVKQITGYADEVFYFDGKAAKWLPAARYRSFPRGGLGGLQMFFLRIFG